MATRVFRSGVAGGVVCLASWLALAVIVGDVGLQQSISRGPESLLEQPAQLVVVGAIAAGVAFGVTRSLRTTATDLIAAVLLNDVLAGLVFAPLAIGELEPIHAPLVFAVVTVVGVQPAATFLGAWAATRSRSQNGV